MKTMVGVRMLPLPTGRTIPVIGQGTWEMGEDPDIRKEEISALRQGLDLGMNLIDTAESVRRGRGRRINRRSDRWPAR
jgi:diketogulonate reductase-like aldo/keto reductase